MTIVILNEETWPPHRDTYVTVEIDGA